MSPWSTRFPLRFLRGDSSRLVLTIVALASGVALVCAIDLASGGVLNAFTEIIDAMAGRAALQVSAGDGSPLSEDLAAKIAAVPGVGLAVPIVAATGFVADGSGEVLTVHGVDITNDAAVRVYRALGDQGGIVDDPLVFLSQPDSLILTRAFAARRGLRDGSAILLDTPAGRRRFTVRGLLEPEGVAKVYGGNLAIMDLYAAEAAFLTPGFVSRVDVVLSRDASRDDVAAAIASVLPSGVRVEAPPQRKADLQRVVTSFRVLLQGVGLMALGAAFLIAFNRLSTMFERRAWQLGIIAAIGMRRRALQGELVKEGGLIGVPAVLLGIAAGIAIGHFLVPVIATTVALNSKVVVPDAVLALSPSSLLLAAILGIATPILASLLPARRAVRVGAATTLRSRSVEAAVGGLRAELLALAGAVSLVTACVALQAATGRSGYGLVGSALILVATAFAGRCLVQVGPVWFGALIRRLGGPAGRLVTAGIALRPRRMALMATTLGVGLGAVFWLWLLARSFEASVVDALSYAIRADLIVTSSNIASGFLEAPLEQAVADEVRSVRGVAAASAWRAIEWPYQGESIGLSAYDPNYFIDKGFGDWQLKGAASPDAWQKVARGEGVVISTSLQQNFGVETGGSLTLETPTGSLTLPVVGVNVDFVSPRGTVQISRELFRERWEDSSLNRVFLQVAPRSSAGDVRAAISQRLGERYAVRILSAGELMEYFSSQVRRAFAVIPIVAGLVWLVVIVGMADTLAADVSERTQELGVARALGLRRGHLYRMVVIESVAICLIGLVLAFGCGASLALLWVKGTFTSLLGWSLDLHVPYGQILFASAASVLVCIIAALAPARLAARTAPATALRYE